MARWQPTLEGKLLRLRPLREDDLEPLFAAASDPLIWELHPEPGRYRRELFEKYFRTGMESGGALAILDRATGEIIGSSRFSPLSRSVADQGGIEIGYTFLTRPYWGGRYNRELKGLMLDHAFKHVEQAFFFVGETNWRSRRAMEKIGGALCGSERHSSLDGRMITSVIYRIAKGDATMAP